MPLLRSVALGKPQAVNAPPLCLPPGGVQFIDRSTPGPQSPSHEGELLTLPSLLALLPLVLGLAGSQADGPLPRVGRLVGEREMIFRVPVHPRSSVPRVQWDEGDRFKCVATSAIRGAVMAGPEHIDLLLPGRQRVRASFDGDCPALDFYGDFYLKTEDHRVCARRDSVHSRMGGSCRIEQFRRLVPKLRD